MNRLDESVKAPFLGILFLRTVSLNQAYANPFHHIQNFFGDIRGFEIALSMLVNHLPLLIHHIIIFQEMLADFKIMAFHFLLGIFNRLGNHTMFDRHTFFHAELEHKIGHALRGKNAQKIVL